jgi:putative pantetheine hydrolase
VVLSGGSAYGLSAATGVMDRLGADGIGFPVGPEPGQVVPIVPAAVIFDLGRGGEFHARPDASFGASALDLGGEWVLQGNVGAGAGALVGKLKGGLGTASTVLPDGTVVAALAVVNAAGSAVDLATGRLYGAAFGLAGEFDSLGAPAEDELAALRAATEPNHGLNTTIGVVATDAMLDKAGCRRLATVAHDGLARAVRPAHSMVDGDTVFALSTCVRAAPDNPIESLALRQALLSAAADCFTRAVVHGVLAAQSVGPHRSYADLAPSVVRTAG